MNFFRFDRAQKIVMLVLRLFVVTDGPSLAIGWNIQELSLICSSRSSEGMY